MELSREMAACSIGTPLLGPELEAHVLRLGRRNAGGFTGYDEEFLILE
jgi:hypothetical protein